MDPETRDAVMAMRGDWKFYATVSFCHTFRALLKLPKFTADQLGGFESASRRIASCVSMQRGSDRMPPGNAS